MAKDGERDDREQLLLPERPTREDPLLSYNPVRCRFGGSGTPTRPSPTLPGLDDPRVITKPILEHMEQTGELSLVPSPPKGDEDPDA